MADPHLPAVPDPAGVPPSVDHDTLPSAPVPAKRALPTQGMGEPATAPFISVVPDETPGRVGRYAVLGEIGRGGMGAVLRGRDPDLGRELALKVMLDGSAGRPEAVQRFREEAQVGGQLQHPGMVPVYELGASDGR